MHWNTTKSLIKSHPFMNNTMICGAYKMCTLCVTSFYPCKWNVNQHKCTDEALWNSNDIVIGDNFDQVHSQTKNDKFHNKFPRNEFYCPQFFTFDDNEPNIYIDVYKEKWETVKVQYRIPAGLINEKYTCEFEIKGNKTTQYAIIKEHSTPLNGYIEGEIECSMPFAYAEKKPNTAVKFSVLQNGSTPLANPRNTCIVLLKCAYVGSHCKTCVEMEHCKWNLETRKCEYISVGSAGNLYIEAKELCKNPAISSFMPEVGPWEGGTRISIYVNNFAYMSHTVGNITVGNIPCTILHAQSTDTEKIISLICVVDRCKSTFYNCSGLIKLTAEDLLLTSTSAFQFVDPKIHDISPTTGPTSGGTELTINGKYMNAGSVIQVYIGDLECVVFENKSTHLKCITGPSKLSFKTYVNIQFDEQIRTTGTMYEYDENLEPDENMQKIPRGVPINDPGTSITFDIPIQNNITEHEEILLYIQDKELVKTHYSKKCDIQRTSLVCPVPNVCDDEVYTLSETKPKCMDYGFKIRSTDRTFKDFDVPKHYPKFLLYPNSVQYLLVNTGKKPTITLINVIVIVLAVVTFTIIAIFIISWRRSAKKSRKMQQQLNKMGMEMIAVSQWVKRVVIQNEIKLDENESNMLRLPNVTIQYTSIPRFGDDETVLKDEYELPPDDTWEIPRKNIVLGKCLGEGQFGKVVEAKVSGPLLQDIIGTTVAVKMLKNNHTDADMVNLVTETQLMKIIGRHENVLRLLGCCTIDGPTLLITEYSSHGNLLDFLQKNHRSTAAQKVTHNDFSEEVLITFALQIAKGMEYLASIRFVHRDLAARNILVFDNYVLKIADFGLARDIRQIDYYKLKTGGKLPVKWMAPEALTDRRHTSKSDVWSYGVLLWEILTLGDDPYPLYNDAGKLMEDIESGYRLKKPANCSINMYCLMYKCWNYLPDDRPEFTNIINDLDAILTNCDKTIEQPDPCGSNHTTESDDTEDETNDLLV